MAIPVPCVRKNKTRSFNTLNYRSFGKENEFACLASGSDERLICKIGFTQFKPHNASFMRMDRSHFSPAMILVATNQGFT